MKPDKLSWIKMQCLKKGITYKQLTKKMNIDYVAFVQQVGGFRRVSDGLEEKVRKVLKEW